MSGNVSPDGRWLLYGSDEGYARLPTVFVQRFPGGANRRQVFKESSRSFRWSRDGKEILIGSGTNVFTIPVRQAGESLETGEPRMLFPIHIDCNVGSGACFDVAPDGKRFLVADGTGFLPPLALLQNWPAALK